MPNMLLAVANRRRTVQHQTVFFPAHAAPDGGCENLIGKGFSDRVSFFAAGSIRF